jgi:hypothetical protein
MHDCIHESLAPYTGEACTSPATGWMHNRKMSSALAIRLRYKAPIAHFDATAKLTQPIVQPATCPAPFRYGFLLLMILAMD